MHNSKTTDEERKVMSEPVTPSASYPTQLLSIEKAAVRLSVSQWTIRNWIRSGKLPSVKLGSRVLVPSDAVQQVIDKATRPAVARAM
jgi:excisionase family DNA binding protein